MTTPTTRTLRHLEAEGWLADIVERRVTKRVTHDLWGCLDVLAIRGTEILGVQVTTGSNVSARIKKLTDSPYLPLIRDAGIAVHVHGWRCNAAGEWVLREVDLS